MSHTCRHNPEAAHLDPDADHAREETESEAVDD